MSPQKQENLYFRISTNSNDEMTLEAQVKQGCIEKETDEENINLFTNILINEESFFKDHILSLVPNIKLITTLKLHNCSLKNLTADIHILDLKELDVSKNNLTTVPKSLYLGLTNLQNLNLSKNYLKEFTEPPMCEQMIEKINLSGNNMNKLPPWVFTSSSKVKELFYSFNQQICLTSGNVKPLNQSVRCFEVKNSQILDNDLFYLKLFGKLSYLDLSNDGKIRSNSINSLKDMFNFLNLQAYLKVLLLNKLGLPELAQNIYKLSNLQELSLEYNDLMTLPAELVQLNKLRILKVGHNQLYELPTDFNSMKNLETFEAQFNFIASIDFRNMPSLRYADLYHNDISDVYLDKDSIEMIDLEYNYISDLDQVCNNYTAKRDRLRERNGMAFSRMLGCIVDESSSEGSGRISPESDVSLCNKEDDIVVEEEYWDLETQINCDFGDITLSDSEYQGEVISVKRTICNESLSDSIYDYLYEDAD